MSAMIGYPAAANAGDGENLTQGNTAFALDLYARLKSADGNLFLSPYSISTCLAMTYGGARGDTAVQMARTLHFAANPSQLAASFSDLQKQLNHQESQGIELNIANGLWGQQDHPFLPAFLHEAEKSYGAKLKQVDFRAQADSARREINDWVDHQTSGKITDLIQRGVLDTTTRLVLVNAIYFKGRWVKEFDPRHTARAPFMVSSAQKSDASLMHLTSDLAYAEADGWQLLELPYVGDKLDLVVLLPREVEGLKGMEDSLNQSTLDRWLAQARPQKVEVFLPKFKLTAQFSLAKCLVEMGMADAFSGRADFSGMDGARDLCLSAVVHKAFVDVNEEGTEAAAATATVARSMAVMRPRPTPVFRADHPFIFLIRDHHSGSILFLGRLVDPTRS